MVLLMVLTFRRSDAFEAAKQYCQTNTQILSQTGEIKYYGVLVGGTISFERQAGNAELDFFIIGAKGNFSVHSTLAKRRGIWVVDELMLQ